MPDYWAKGRAAGDLVARFCSAFDPGGEIPQCGAHDAGNTLS
jgi:hypothetical protein